MKMLINFRCYLDITCIILGCFYLKRLIGFETPHKLCILLDECLRGTDAYQLSTDRNWNTILPSQVRSSGSVAGGSPGFFSCWGYMDRSLQVGFMDQPYLFTKTNDAFIHFIHIDIYVIIILNFIGDPSP